MEGPTDVLTESIIYSSGIKSDRQTLGLKKRNRISRVRAFVVKMNKQKDPGEKINRHGKTTTN